MILPFLKHYPTIHPSAFIAPGADVIGRVKIGRGSSVWFGAVIRGDINRIWIGRGANIQDNCVLHVESDLPCVVGDNVTLGHQATVHGCTIGEGAVIGMGSRILNGSRIGRYSIIGAGSVVLENTKIPPQSLAVGIPARVVRRTSVKEANGMRQQARRYGRLAASYHDLKVFSRGDGVTFLDDLSHIFT